MSSEKIEFLALGDIVIDAFIDLLDAEVHCDINDENCTISMRFGDKIPYKDVVVVPAVGNSPNAAVAASRLGLRAALLTHIGDDRHGEECITRLQDEHVATDYIVTEKGKKTNYHYVLRYNAERTILIKHENYTYDFQQEIEGVPEPAWIYFSSVADNTLPYHHAVAQYLAEHPTVQLAFQPGTFQISLGYEKLQAIYQASAIFFCNVEEARRILGHDGDVKKLLVAMHERGPKMVCITDGPNGAYAYDGTEGWYIPMYPDPKPPLDRTGAGDSFSSTFTSAIARGKSIPEALQWGPINSMSVVQYIGAQEGLLSEDDLKTYIAQAPADYQPQKLDL